MLSTDPEHPYCFPDNTTFTNAKQVEDWIIKIAEQIKSERQDFDKQINDNIC